MIIKAKIGIIALIIASFVMGGFAFSAYQVGAAENGNSHKLDFFGGGLRGLNGIDKDSAEWQEWQAKMEERKAEMGEFKTMIPEERQAKMEEFKANRPENGEWTRLRQGFGGQEGRGLKFGHFGFRGLRGFADEANYEVVNLDNGVQITITSDDSEIVQKIQEMTSRK